MSIHQQIVELASEKIAAINGIPRRHVRSQPFRLKVDPLPFVSVTRGAEQPGSYVFGGSIFYEYEVIFTILFEQGMKLEGGIDDAKSLRQRIRQVLIPPHDSDEKPLPTLPIVTDAEAFDLPAEEETATKAGYEKASLGVIYRSNQNYRGD